MVTTLHNGCVSSFLVTSDLALTCNKFRQSSSNARSENRSTLVSAMTNTTFVRRCGDSEKNTHADEEEQKGNTKHEVSVEKPPYHSVNLT